MLLLLSMAPLLVAGCEPCERVCAATADAYALCLGEWEMTWDDVGYAGAEVYEEQCKEEAQLERGRRTDAEQMEVDRTCSDMDRLLRSSHDCQELYDLLEEL